MKPRATDRELRVVRRTPALIVLTLVSFACDTPPADSPTIENATTVDLEVFEMTLAGEELAREMLMPGSIFRSRDECAGPFVIRTPDGELYARLPELCRGDAPFVVSGPDSGG